MKNLFRFFASRHILASLITIMIFLMGLNTLYKIKRDVTPEVDYGIMTISTYYPGASPEDVELNVTNKIEDELKTVTGIKLMTSSSMENTSSIYVEISPDEKDQEKVKREIREAVNRVTDFPEEVTDNPYIKEWSTSNEVSVIQVAITGDIPYRDKREYARVLEKKIKSLPRVSQITKYGYRAREVRVEVDPMKLYAYHMPLMEIINAMRLRNIRASTGTFESYAGEKKMVTLSQFDDPMEVGDVIVRASFDGPTIRISDLAVINDDFEEERVIPRVNGENAIYFNIFKKENADAIRTTDEVKALIDGEQASAGAKGMDLVISQDMSVYVRQSLNVVSNNAVIGLCLVMILLTLFLNLRTAFWVALGIPVSLLGTTFLLPLFNTYLDTITLTSMVMVIGIIVDDAIIISENIYQHRERGKAPLQAVVDGISEVFFPVLTTILTTFFAFAPMFFMTGIFGKFVFVIPLTISLALFVSLIESTLALPAHLLPGLFKSKDLDTKRSHWFVVLRDWYRKAMCKVLRFRYALVAVFTLALILSFGYAAQHIPFILFPSKQAEMFTVYVDMPTGTDLAETETKIHEIESIILGLPKEELESCTALIGTNQWSSAEAENSGQIIVNLTPYSKRNRLKSRLADDIVEHLREQTDKIAGSARIFYQVQSGGPPVGSPIDIKVIGPGDESRKALADDIVAYLATIDGVKDVDRDDREGKEQLVMDLDYEKLSRLGLSVADVARNVRAAYDGDIVTSVRYGEEDVNFKIMVEEKHSKDLDSVKNFRIPNSSGRMIRVSEVVSFDNGPGESDHHHYDGERTITITGDVNKDIITPLEATAAVLDRFGGEADSQGLRLIKGGESVETEKSMRSLGVTMVVAFIGIYFILVLLFNSLLQPFLVMAAIPFGMIGVIMAFAVHREPFSFLAMLGVIGMGGVVVNDSLVLVNHLNKLREDDPGRPIKERVAEGASNRLRAIIMTTLTTVAGLLPLAYGLGGDSPYMSPMALALGSGLLFATLLTLVLIPSLYTIGYDMKQLVTGKGFSRKEKQPE